MSTKFDSSFWEATLSSLSYPIKAETLDLSTLKETKAVPRDFPLKGVSRLYQDDYTEIAILQTEDDSKLSRSICTRTARTWRQNRLRRPLLLFTNGIESYAIIVPGKRIDGEAKILWLSDTLYRTDREVIESLRFPGGADLLRQGYDSVFLPYEKVRNEFFTGYRVLYEKIEKAVHKHLKKEASSYAQRFLGRLMFIYFLQRRGWLNKDKQFINSIDDYKKLNELFYESLSKEGTPGIPFLNGSLFEREDYMTVSLEKDLFKEMDILFKEARDFFNNYNFTVDEASPLELEVSIDPALIGTVFENMLPEYERGSKGTFYTPASESSFICRRALTNYLGYPDRISDDKKRFWDGLRLHIEKLREMKSEKEVRDFREELLKTVVLDPAVGSGGFLLVAMQEIILTIQEAESTVGWKSDPVEYKKRILPNLYGFDVEGEAVEIARLRLWLSLLIDQKEPEPLPNLDMNLVQIRDSLRLPDIQTTLDATIEDLRTNFHDLKAKYLNEHDTRAKLRLRDQLNNIRLSLSQKTGTDPFVIEAFMPTKADIVVMNPPYVRQESIQQKSKDYYVACYGLDKKSDLYTYFLVRALELIQEHGIIAVISSDKWMEVGYGVSLQRKLKDGLITIFCQHERVFGADVNTVISVYGRKNVNEIAFAYLDSYTTGALILYSSVRKDDLAFGRWFQLRTPSVILQEILPMLTHKLGDFAEIRFGIKTGSNEFFYMKDVSDQYERDILSNRSKFTSILARSQTDLVKLGLIYIENEGGERFVVDSKDVKPVLRSPSDSNTRIIRRLPTLMLYTDAPGKATRKYIEWGENHSVIVKRGNRKNRIVVGYNNLESNKSREPWYDLTELVKPSSILLIRFIRERHFDLLSEQPILTDQTACLLYPLTTADTHDYRHSNWLSIWIYTNSIVFLITKELWGMRMGGAGAVLQLFTKAFTDMPVFDLSRLKIPSNFNYQEIIEIKRIQDELQTQSRKNFDLQVLKFMGIEDSDKLLSKLYDAMRFMVNDRLVKGKDYSLESPPDTNAEISE